MKILFDRTKYTKWYIDEKGRAYSISTYCNRDGKLNGKAICINKKRGYAYVRTTNKNLQVHRLVASAFIPNPENKPCVNHKDGNKRNNDISNLEWCTPCENARHALEAGLTRQLSKNEGNIKYTNEQCSDVLKRIGGGMTYVEAGSPYNMPYSTVAHLKRGSRRQITY